NYIQENNFSSLSSELNSSFLGGRLNNTLRITWSFQNEPRSLPGGNRPFPFVDIFQGDAVLTSFGSELFSHGNLREVNTINITDEITYTTGIHTLTAGFTYEFNNIKNGFMRAGAGWYIFDSWEDFVEGRNSRLFAQTISNLPGFEQPFPSFQFHQYSLFFQNDMRISPRFNLTAGIRFDLPTYPDNVGIQTHETLAGLEFPGGRFFDTGTLPRTRLMVSPRVGFNYDITGDRSIVARGGTGIFTGRIPFVWIVSQSGDAGMLQSSIFFDEGKPFNPDPNAWLPATPPTPGVFVPTTFTVMDPEFRMPSAWKTSMAVDFRLPLGLNASIEGIFNKDINAVAIHRYGMIDPVPMAGPDNRMVYLPSPSRFIHRVNPNTGVLSPTATGGVQPLFITNVPNSESGHYFSLTGRLEKRFWRGLSGMISYTRNWARSLNDGVGDQVGSAWGIVPTIHGGNSRELGFAGYVMPNNLMSALSYRIEYANHFSTTISLFYSGGNSGRGSYTFGNNIVNDAGANNLIWVPNDPSEITFVDRTVGGNVWTAQEQSDAFFRFIEQDRYLSSRRGQYAERGGVVLPWAHHFDIRVMQNFYLNAGGRRHTLQVSLDMMNVGNLLHSSWGNRWQMNQASILNVTNVNALGNGETTPTFQLNPVAGTNEMPTESFRRVATQASTYWIQLGIRYIF
ncbi:MAG: TonB-dependent receptor, partial [Bacteroidales bacterium]|nr:TonB-dependent receptor [Bacteroidales bacterium]